MGRVGILSKQRVKEKGPRRGGRTRSESLECQAKAFVVSKETIPNCASLKDHELNHSRPGPARTFQTPVALSVISRTPVPREARGVPLLGTDPEVQ
mgnify:CR=1 FL=1